MNYDLRFFVILSETYPTMKKTFIVAILALVAGTASAQSLEIPLWPDGPAESNGITEPEQRNGWSWRNTTQAAMFVWPAEGENTGRAVVIFPGGGYAMLVEGADFAESLASQGITTVLVKYRLPNGHHNIPLTDALQAMRIVRRNASDWGVDPEQIGVAGFSAGGHLASTVLTHYDEGTRPAFGILFYPVITMGAETHAGSRNFLLGENPTPELEALYSNHLQVTPETPRTLIFFSNDDRTVHPANGTMFYDALKARNVLASLYIFPSGGHGWGFRPSFRYHETVKSAALDWITSPIEELSGPPRRRP